MKAPITIILCLFAIALAQKQRVAIMPTVADAEAKLTPSEQGLLMERLRAYASDVLPKSDFILLQQNYVIEKLGEENFFKACKEGSCVGELIAMVSADFGARCEVFVANNKKWLKFELYGTLRGEDYPGTISTFIEAVRDFNAMVALIDKKAPAAFKEIIPKAPPAQAKTAPPEPVPAPKPEPEPKPEQKPAYVVESVVLAPAVRKECKSRFNINELVFKIESSLASQLKDCSATLAKNIALSKSPFGKKTPAPEPRSFMTECAIEGIKHKLPPGAGEYIKPVEGFVQNILNAASAANGELDVKKLSGAIGGMNVNDLISELKAKAAYDDCAVDEPYEPPAALEGDYEDDDEEEGGDGERKVFSLGIRGGGFYYPRMDAEYGLYGGLVFDWALSDWFHLQPGVIVSNKYAEVPLLLSLKFSALRINAGPYFDFLINDSYYYFDFGISAGFGFDIGRFHIFGFEYGFYIGMFYDYSLTESYSYRNGNGYLNSNQFYNRTLGLNLGVNFL